MFTQVTLGYLSKLLNKPLTEGAEISLSSAQKSRVNSWLVNNDISFNESALNGKFTINELLTSDGISANKNKPFYSGLTSASHKLDAGNTQVGIDIQRVDELFPKGLSSDPKVDKELIQIFTLKELSYAQAKTDPEGTLTGIFCAKEAIQKASNLNASLIEIEVLPDEQGRPQSNGYELSISHSGNYAVAIAVKGRSEVEKDSLNNWEIDPRITQEKYFFSRIRWIDGIYISLFIILIFTILIK